MFVWWRDVVKEANQGEHTPVVDRSALRHDPVHRFGSYVLRGVVLGLLRWRSSTSDAFRRPWRDRRCWPPKGVELFDPWHLPLVNTLILLTSGTTVTWAHHALQDGDRKGAQMGASAHGPAGHHLHRVQAYEYSHERLLREYAALYGSTFFMATGFHGFHVLIGTIFLFVCLVRAYGRLHAEAAFRLRGGRLVLALRRRGVAVPVRLHLCLGLLGRRRSPPLSSPSDPSGAGEPLPCGSRPRNDRQLLSRPFRPLDRLTAACPNCGRGRLFSGFLRSVPRVRSRGLSFPFADPGDGPAVFIILIVWFPRVGLPVLGRGGLIRRRLGAPAGRFRLDDPAPGPAAAVQGLLIAPQYQQKQREAVVTLLIPSRSAPASGRPPRRPTGCSPRWASGRWSACTGRKV